MGQRVFETVDYYVQTFSIDGNEGGLRVVDGCKKFWSVCSFRKVSMRMKASQRNGQSIIYLFFISPLFKSECGHTFQVGVRAIFGKIEPSASPQIG